MIRVESEDGTPVAVHDLGGQTTAEGPPLLLFCHATGFHGRCYLPMAEALGDRFHSVALDFHGHGETPRPPDWQVDWQRYGDDALAVARTVAPSGGVVGVGHSLGGAALVMAAHRQPELFDLLVLYEPVIYPPREVRFVRHGPSGLAAGARRRRATFPSIEAAYERYAAKPPLNAFEPAALWSYVTHGFGPDPDDPTAVRLCCEPEHEARTFELGAEHRTWDLLPDVHVPVVVVRGRVEETTPSTVADAVADRLADGRPVALEQLDHFAPMTHPRVVADVVAHWIEQGRRSRTV